MRTASLTEVAKLSTAAKISDTAKKTAKKTNSGIHYSNRVGIKPHSISKKHFSRYKRSRSNSGLHSNTLLRFPVANNGPPHGTPFPPTPCYSHTPHPHRTSPPCCSPANRHACLHTRECPHLSGDSWGMTAGGDGWRVTGGG